MPVGVREHARVAAVEGLRRLARDRGAGLSSPLDDGRDLLAAPDVVRERDPAPAAGVGDAAVLRALLTAPEREDGVADLEEDRLLDVHANGPAEPLVERPGGRHVRDAEGDQADPLLHAATLATGPDGLVACVREPW